MSGSNPSRGARAAIFLAFLAVAFLTAVILYERARFRRATDRLSVGRAELQAQLEARDLTISQLKAEIRNLRSLVGASAPSPSRPRDPSALRNESALRQQLSELQASHSNTLALAGSLLAEQSGAAATEEARKANESVVAELESATSEAIQNAETARQKTEELLRTLNVPPGVEATEIEAGLASPNLRAYWPYFEARREQDLLERVVDALRLRLLQETAGTTAETFPADNSR